MANKKRKKKSAETVKKDKDIISQAEQAIAHNKILKSILIIILVIAVAFVAFIFISKSLTKFEYRGVDFEVVKFCDSGPPCLTTYKTSLPVRVYGNNTIKVVRPSEKTNDYNFYIRNDPRDLDVDFKGQIVFKENMVLNSEEDFICEGKGAIAGANLVRLYEILGARVMKDENATCDPFGRYTLITIKQGNETKIEHRWPACYDIYIKDCEVLEGTEKFMIETFVEFNKIMQNQSS